jgi:hypothetical protein
MVFTPAGSGSPYAGVAGLAMLARPVTDLAELVPGHRGPLQVLLG